MNKTFILFFLGIAVTLTSAFGASLFSHESRLVRLETKIDYIADGVKYLLEHNRGKK